MTVVSSGAIPGGALVDRFGPTKTIALEGVTRLGAALVAAGKPLRTKA